LYPSIVLTATISRNHQFTDESVEQEYCFSADAGHLYCINLALVCVVLRPPKSHSSLRSAMSDLHMLRQRYVKLHSPRQAQSCHVKPHPWCVKTASSLIIPHQTQFCRVKPAVKLTRASVLLRAVLRPRQTTLASHSCYTALDSVELSFL
jgi:hypothetical protein